MFLNPPAMLLDQVHFPKDLRSFQVEDLPQLSQELRDEVIRIVSHTGGHLGASLGVIELTIALHYVFETPKDRLIWDIGHQTYPHKILTGRRQAMMKLRQAEGPSGFTRRSESEYDAFGAAHSSTSISAALGFAAARDLKGEAHNVVAVIGDGAMSAGMAYEAMNNASHRRFLLILNDNDMSIAPPVGAMSTYLSKLLSSKPYHSFRNLAKGILPKSVESLARRMEEVTKGIVSGGTLFEELGFYYVGPIDGHNLDHLLPILSNLRDVQKDGPVLLHVITQKGKGYGPAEGAPDKCHGVNRFDIVTGKQITTPALAPTYTSVFSTALLKEAEKDERIVAITAAMPSGTGLDVFSKKFPERFFDVGIAEQHAVTFAAGLACEGMKPFVALYSTFLQRAYDQVIHDVILQRLPVRFMIDRAGFVGNDGPTHAGSYDLAYLLSLPDIVVMAPSDEAELLHMVATASRLNDQPCAVRYPRGEGIGVLLPSEGIPLEIGKARVVKQGSTLALLSLGTRLRECLKAAERLDAQGFSTTVVDARFAKPLDHDMMLNLAQNHRALITIEEGSRGGFGAHVLHELAGRGALDHGFRIRTLTFPDTLMEHDSQDKQYEKAGLQASHIEEVALMMLTSQFSLAS